jgi:hypothetical protein
LEYGIPIRKRNLNKVEFGQVLQRQRLTILWLLAALAVDVTTLVEVPAVV